MYHGGRRGAWKRAAASTGCHEIRLAAAGWRVAEFTSSPREHDLENDQIEGQLRGPVEPAGPGSLGARAAARR
jgi:hypothetical protein